jgi:sugar/nucleoside kinase (ribokinase family)
VLFANADEARELPLPLPGTTGGGQGRRPADHGAAGRRRDAGGAGAAVDGVRDSTGAGDAFAAGWLSATMEGRDGTACVQRAHELARAVLATPGARPDRPGGRT